ALMRKVVPSVDAELDATFPGQRAARVAITARGRREELLQPTRKGDPDLPLTDAELEDKYMELVAPVSGRAAAQALLVRLWRLECA
ncbi:MAG TPA: MmgE/PrpD family protein, partial [Burkholderiales bacterium]|nr:MmgE/PrpD family protein [Burkholderiales bacterium]